MAGSILRLPRLWQVVIAAAVGMASCLNWLSGWLWPGAVAVAGDHGCGWSPAAAAVRVAGWWVAGCLDCGRECVEFGDAGWCCGWSLMVAPALVGG